MDKITTYLYTMGTPNELGKGEIELLRSSEDPKELIGHLSANNSGGILIPRFIGVYQKERLISQGNEGGNSSFLEEGFRFRSDLLDQVSNGFLGYVEGEADSLNPRLIFIGYNPELWRRSIVEESIMDNLHRVAVGSYLEMPDFYEKDISLVDEIVDRGQEIYEESKDKTKAVQGVSHLVKELDEYRGTFGLTRTEYSFLIRFKNAQKKRTGILKGPRLKEEIGNLGINIEY